MLTRILGFNMQRLITPTSRFHGCLGMSRNRKLDYIQRENSIGVEGINMTETLRFKTYFYFRAIEFIPRWSEKVITASTRHEESVLLQPSSRVLVLSGVKQTLSAEWPGSEKTCSCSGKNNSAPSITMNQRRSNCARSISLNRS